jgi:hypothetical protein
MHTAGPMRANRAITRQEAHYTRHQRSSACLDYPPTRLEPASVSCANRTRSLRPRASFGSGSEITWSRSARSLASAKNLPCRENIFLSAADLQHTHCQRGRFLMCGGNQGALGFSIGRIVERVAAPLGPTIIPARAFPESESDSSWERLAVLSSIRAGVGTFYQGRVGWDEMLGTEAQLPAYWCKGPQCVDGRDARPPLEAGHL